MSDIRNERLKADYRDMLKIQNRPYLSWIATKGEPPFVEEYLLNVKIRCYVLSVISGKYTVGVIDNCVIKITLWNSYPYVAPNIKMLSLPPVFHPNWYSKGTYCPSEPWSSDISLKDYVKRMLEALMYVPSAIETSSPANFKALDWYIKNRDNASFFPSDSIELTENNLEEIAETEKAAAPFGEVIDSWPK